MSRAIKFRIWDKEEKEMVYWEPFKYNDNSFVSAYNEHTDTLMQYTGLEDKNKKPIFEGDIFNVPEDMEFDASGKYARVVIIEPLEACLYISYDKEFSGDQDCAYLKSDTGWYSSGNYDLQMGNVGSEIIGNIYQNQQYFGDPILLKL